MTIPRSVLVSDEISQWYHIISRCVRGAYLCGDGYEHRKEMIRQRLMHLCKTFCIEVASYAFMDNHLHMVLRLDPHGDNKLSDEDVVRRYRQRMPAHWDWDDETAVPDIDDAQLAKDLKNPAFIVKCRAHLTNMGCCLRALKEPISRRCNREDACSGAFWEKRYQSIPLLDQAAVMSCMAYVDLNPVRACMAESPEQSNFTGVQDRIDVRQLFEKEHGLRKRLSSVACSNPLIQALQKDAATAMQHAESHLWLTPIKACITNDWGIRDNGWSVDDYLTLIDETGRMIRSGKRGSINKKLAPILQRLNLDVDVWITCMSSHQQMIGSAIGQINTRLQEACRRGVRWIRNRCSLFADTT